MEAYAHADLVAAIGVEHKRLIVIKAIKLMRNVKSWEQSAVRIPGLK
jgi:hypothetical protein